MWLGHIQQEFQAVKADWPAHDLWEWLKKGYTLQNTAIRWATITSIDELTYATCKNMPEYRSKYYALKASIKEQNIYHHRRYIEDSDAQQSWSRVDSFQTGQLHFHKDAFLCDRVLPNALSVIVLLEN